MAQTLNFISNKKNIHKAYFVKEITLWYYILSSWLRYLEFVIECKIHWENVNKLKRSQTIMNYNFTRSLIVQFLLVLFNTEALLTRDILICVGVCSQGSPSACTGDFAFNIIWKQVIQFKKTYLLHYSKNK